MAVPPSPAENAADQAAAAGLAVDARRLLEAAVSETPKRLGAWMKLAAMCRATGDFQAALQAISQALTIDPLDFSALLSKATLLEKLGEEAAAGEAYGHALAQLPRGEAPPPALKPILAYAQERYRSFQLATMERLRGGLAAGLALDQEQDAAVQRFCSNIARLTTAYPQQPSHFHYPGLPVFEFHPRSRFAWLEQLEAATELISQEFKALLASEAAALVPYVQYPKDVPLRQWKALNQSRDWTAIHLLRNGVRVEENARHCPGTMALLERLPQPRISGRSPNAMFSLLAPGTRIPPHTGVANTRLVCHLPLIIPEGCGFRVGAETREWDVGKAFVFDDTVEHEAWNDSEELRVVFIFDVWAWALSEPERRAIGAVMAGSGLQTSDAL